MLLCFMVIHVSPQPVHHAYTRTQNLVHWWLHCSNHNQYTPQAASIFALVLPLRYFLTLRQHLLASVSYHNQWCSLIDFITFNPVTFVTEGVPTSSIHQLPLCSALTIQHLVTNQTHYPLCFLYYCVIIEACTCYLYSEFNPHQLNSHYLQHL